MTHKYVFDYHDDDVYWCTADVGWVTGHSYIVYGPLANGATTLMFEGVPNYPDTSRFWQVIDKHQVKIFYTAPTAIRALMREGDAPVKKRHAQDLCAARHGRRADQSRGLAVVSPRGRRGALPDRRHLVADRDRRHSDHARCPARTKLKPGSATQAVLRRAAGACVDADGQGAGRRRQRQSLPIKLLARPDAHGLRRPPALHRHLLQAPIPASTSPATAAAAMPTATTGSPAASTT